MTTSQASETNAPVRLYLVGPTGAGKKSVAIRIFDALRAELIAMDSMKVYRGLEIGTATPEADTLQSVPYHLVNVREPHESFSVAEYIRRVEEIEEQIRGRERRPLFVGGTGLYLERLLNGLFEGPEADWDLRERLKKEAEERGREALHERLAEVDPERASEIHPNDRRRVVRALEVFEKTGRPMSALQEEARRDARCYDHRVALLLWPRETLYERINARVERMIEEGWVEEARRLRERKPLPGKHVLQAVGYSEIFEYLDGERTREEMIEAIKTEHRNLARKQLTRFRNLDHPVRRVEPESDDTVDEVAQRVLERLSGRSGADEG